MLSLEQKFALCQPAQLADWSSRTWNRHGFECNGLKAFLQKYELVDSRSRQTTKMREGFPAEYIQNYMVI